MKKHPDIKLGDSATISKVFSDKAVQDFAELSSDQNPVHLDEAFAKTTIFGRRIVHGFLVGSLISAVVARKLPGPGSIYLKQELNFIKPAYLGEEITAIVTVTDIPKAEIYVLNTRCVNSNGEEIINGYAVIKLLKL